MLRSSWLDLGLIVTAMLAVQHTPPAVAASGSEAADPATATAAGPVYVVPVADDLGVVEIESSAVAALDMGGCVVWAQAIHEHGVEVDWIHSIWGGDELPGPTGYWEEVDPAARRPDGEHTQWIQGAADYHGSCIVN
jgi:hypothetical protein